MAVAFPASPPLSFGIYQLDPSRWELRRRGILIGLQQQPCRVLHLLASRPQEVVSREEIRRLLWPGEVAGDFDLRINFCLARVRDALGDDADNPRFIRTVRGQGYCFLAPRLDLPVAPAAAPIAVERAQGWA
ncbi:MAG: winged helix-turn-helix domain-containing protein, partial [Terriglobales bacterium]